VHFRYVSLTGDDVVQNMPVLRPGMLPGSPQYQGLCRWCSEVLPGTGRLRWYGHVL